MTYNDPTIVHSGRCAACDVYVRDNEEDLSPDGLCDDCETEARLADLADAWDDIDADYTAALTAALASPGVTPSRSWLQIAADIVGVGR